MKHRFGYTAAAIVLSVVPLAGCDSAQDQLSKADACGDLIEISLSELRAVREQLGNPEGIERNLRDAADSVRAKLDQIEDTEVERAATRYADRMQELAEKAANGETMNIDMVARANQELAQACS